MEERPGPESRSRETIQFSQNTQAMIDTARNIEDRLTGPGVPTPDAKLSLGSSGTGPQAEKDLPLHRLGSQPGGCEIPQMPVHQNLQIRAQTGDRQENLAATDATGEDRSLPLVCTTARPGDPRETAENPPFSATPATGEEERMSNLT